MLNWYKRKIGCNDAWWTQRNSKGVFYEIVKIWPSEKFILYVCGTKEGTFGTLQEAINKANAMEGEGR